MVQNIPGTSKGSDHTTDIQVGGSRVVFSESSRVIDLGRIGVQFQNGQVMQSNAGVKQSKDQVKIDLGVIRVPGIFLIFFWVSPDMGHTCQNTIWVSLGSKMMLGYHK